MKLLSRQEEIVLLSIWKLGDNAYGVSVREFISELTDKYWSIGSIYVPLERLTEKSMIEAYQGEPSMKRGGRRIRYYRITTKGMEALSEIRKLQNSLWEGFPGPAAS